MPLGRICPRCGAMYFTSGDHCPDRAGNRRRAAKPQKKVYHSARWGRIRRYVRSRAEGLCEKCGAPGTICDHVDGFTDADDPRAWDTDRMQWLCARCSGRKDAQAVYR